MNPALGRILYVITDLKRGGVPLHLRRLVHAMRDRGWDVSVVSLGQPAEIGRLLAEDGVHVIECGARGMWDLRPLIRLASILRETDPDVAHSFLFHANIALRLAALEVGFPTERVLCEIQTVEVERRWHLAVDRWTHRLCRCVIGNSPSVVEHLSTSGGIPRSHLQLVHGGIDVEPYDAAKPYQMSQLGLPEDAQVILWVGRLDPVKGLSLLIHAFRAIVKDTRAHLLLAGEGPEQSKLQYQVNRLALGGRVHFLGTRTDVPRLLKTASVFAFPSRTEGLPNALLEAMAASCAIVTTDVPGCRDLIRDEHNGLIVPYSDIPALSGAIRRMFTDTEASATLGNRARQDVVASWSSKRMLSAYEEVYRTVSNPI